VTKAISKLRCAVWRRYRLPRSRPTLMICTDQEQVSHRERRHGRRSRHLMLVGCYFC
jgi:hypothetical protein